MGTIINIRISRADAESLNTSKIEETIADLIANPERARQRQGSFVFSFDGYDDVVDEVAAIPETRTYVRRLYERIPPLLYFVAPERETGNVFLFVSVFARPESLEVGPGGAVAVMPDREGMVAIRNAIVDAARLAQSLADDVRGIVEPLVADFPPELADYLRKAVRLELGGSAG